MLQIIFNNNSGYYGILESDYYSISINDCSFDSNIGSLANLSSFSQGLKNFFWPENLKMLLVYELPTTWTWLTWLLNKFFGIIGTGGRNNDPGLANKSGTTDLIVNNGLRVLGDSAYSSSYYVTPRSYRSYTEDSTEKSISVYKREHAALRSLVERSFKLVKDHAACSIKQKSKLWFHACVVMTCFYMVNMELSFVDYNHIFQLAQEKITLIGKLNNDNNNFINNQFLNNNNNNEEDEIIKKIKGKENVKIKAEKKNNNKFLGIIIVFLITLFMATSAELSQFIVSSDYKAPFTIIWFSTIILSFSLVIEFILLKIELMKERKDGLKINFDDVKHIDYNINSSISGSCNYEINYTKQDTLFQRFQSKFKVERGSINAETGETINTGITFKKLFIISIPMSILFVGLNWIWMLAISMTEVSISTALYQSASVFCFFLSIIILKEKVKILKTISVIIFMGGIVGIAIATIGTSKGEYPHAIKGEILMIISAAMWGLYEVLTSKFIGDANRTIVHTYMGLIAFVNLILGIPVIVILNITKFEPFSLPSASVFGMLLLNALVGFSVNYLINWGLSVTSPLFVRSGELMVIVATLLFDIIIKHMKLPLLALPGYSLIVIGFILSVYIESRDIKQQQQQQQQQQQENENEKNNNGETESLLNY
ncbi:hypothetical protein ACTFIZ_006054 [Dictyostelium cf. discoideum]